ncbi:PhaM family polyhydroxyalkanoate granule multifunctional regulatory protein [Castellaniella sp.]|uniref:PhaM family polyhydroxyalkanoate granule multifunctional regulatory protein n=1 Tax=Castellaniella sp. TaxID=1955812 RepID=UPI00356575C1
MNNNPFVLPGFGQSGPQGQNPLLASMEMMRQAWQGLASPGGLDPAAMGSLMSVEELDKRISDLRAVENWLRMNLSMLSSTIQGLEVQRATLSTLKSFMDTGMATMAQAAAGTESAAAGLGGADKAGMARPQSSQRAASPLEEVLGMTPGAEKETAAAPAAQDEAPRGQSDESDAKPAGPAADPAESPGMAGDAQSDIVGATASAAQGWWNLLQQQFQSLATATAASTEGAFSELKGAAMPPAGGAARAASPGTARKAAKAATKTTATAAKKAGKKTAARPTTAKRASKATARKTGAARKTTE